MIECWYAAGIWHAAWSLLKFIPAELLYSPYETHASLQQKCVLSLISAIMAKIKDAVQPWYKVKLSSLSDILLALVSMIAISVLSPALTIAVTVLCFGLDMFLDVTATNFQATFQAVSSCVRLGTLAVGVPVAVALGLIKNGGSVEDLFDDEASGWQTALKLVSRRLTVIGHCVGCIACTPWTLVRQYFTSGLDYDSPKTKEILASIGAGRAHSQAKRTAPSAKRQRKTKPARTGKDKASRTPLPSEVSSAAVSKSQSQLQRELQSSPTAAKVSDAAHQLDGASFRTDWKPARTTGQSSADEPIPRCRADVKDHEAYPVHVQYSNPVGESKKSLQASGAAESHKKAVFSSCPQSAADMATAAAVVMTPSLGPHSHVQPVTQQQAAASKASAEPTTTAAEQLTTPLVTPPHTGAAAVTAHSIPAHFQHLFPSVSMQPETLKSAEMLPKQNKSSAQSLMPSLPLSSAGGTPRRADKNADGYVRAADKAVDGQIPFQCEAASPSEDARTVQVAHAAGCLSDKSGNKAAGHPDGPNVCSGLAASAPSMADQQPCIGQGAGSDDGDEASKCIICWTTDRETTLAPCGHRVLCRYFHRALCVFGTAVFPTAVFPSRDECCLYTPYLSVKCG